MRQDDPFKDIAKGTVGSGCGRAHASCSFARHLHIKHHDTLALAICIHDHMCVCIYTCIFIDIKPSMQPKTYSHTSYSAISESPSGALGFGAYGILGCNRPQSVNQSISQSDVVVVGLVALFGNSFAGTPNENCYSCFKYRCAYH